MSRYCVFELHQYSGALYWIPAADYLFTSWKDANEFRETLRARNPGQSYDIDEAKTLSHPSADYAKRFKAGEWEPVPLPSGICYEPDQIGATGLRVSKQDRRLIEFDDIKSKRTVQMKLGRFLNAKFNFLTKEEVRDATDMYDYFVLKSGRIKVGVTETAEAAEYVYRNGPKTCMSFSEEQSENGLPVSHPARAYSEYDLRVAYVSSSDGRVLARTVVWPDRQIHSTIYGNTAIIQSWLKDHGYTHGHFKGARIARVPMYDTYPKPLFPNMIAAPYLDDHEFNHVWYTKRYGVVNHKWGERTTSEGWLQTGRRFRPSITARIVDKLRDFGY